MVDDMSASWGYSFLDAPHPDSFGYSGLVIAIREKPTGQHFDPEMIHLHLCDATGGMRGTTLSWHSPRPASDRVCLSRVILADRFDQRVEFLTFGGLLEMTPDRDKVVYTLRSPAPVLEILGQEASIPDQLAFETESLLSREAARWGRDDRGFEQRLAKVEPMQLYVAVLHSLLQRHKQIEAMEIVYPDLDDALLNEKRWLKARGLWPDKPPMPSDLLSPA
jgi:hypothetical protein